MSRSSLIPGLLAAFLVCVPAIRLAADNPAPFRVGEEMTFEIRCLGINAAWQKLRVDAMTNVNGRQAYKIVSILRTYPAVEVFYVMHDTSVTCLDVSNLNVLSVYSSQRQGKWRNLAVITNSPSRHTIYYLRNGKRLSLLRYAGPVVDLIGMVYHGRALPQTIGTLYSFSIINIEKIKNIKAKVVGLEKKKVPVLGPQKVSVAKIQQVDAEDEDKYEDVAFWVTADPQKIPVRIRSMKIRLGPVDLGNVESVLVRYTNTRPAAR